jgi:RNA polymerase sigma-70 factor (ECF subfamily)
LYTVAKNKTKDYLRRDKLFAQKISRELNQANAQAEEIEIDLSGKNIEDSQLAMMFAVCHPCISPEAQVALALNLLCGFSPGEIADAFLTNTEVIYKRIQRAKEKLRTENVRIAQPTKKEIHERMETILLTIYLLFNEGYHSSSTSKTIRQDLCLEAMRLALLLVENENTHSPEAGALLSLMCFHASRFDARTTQNGEIILYEDQDDSLWNKELVEKGERYLNEASTGKKVSRYHIEAAIAYWHTQKKDTREKWENILQLYNRLLFIRYSPAVALNRTYALAKANGNEEGIREAEKLKLETDPFYHSLLGKLYETVDAVIALEHYVTAHKLARSAADRASILKQIGRMGGRG